MPPSRMQTRG
uniref:Uncharacterized protein n=1 Tax=Anguilla anguilla TaxID=7936 RepID=A0A0E9SAM7_ANGAN